MSLAMGQVRLSSPAVCNLTRKFNSYKLLASGVGLGNVETVGSYRVDGIEGVMDCQQDDSVRGFLWHVRCRLPEITKINHTKI